MALILEVSKDDTIEVIASKDGSIGLAEGERQEAYAKYLETLDESLLKLKPDAKPTRFVLKKVLGFGMAQRIKSTQAKLDEEGKPQVQLGFIMDEVRASLVGIKDPGTAALEFRKDSDGYASKDLVALLESAGVANELYAARQGAVQVGAPKKS